MTREESSRSVPAIWAYKEFYRSKNPLVHGCWLLYLCFLIYLCIIYFLLLLKFLCRRKYCCFLRLFFSLHCSKRCESFFDCCVVLLLSTQPTLKYIRDWIRVNRLNNGAVRYPSDRDAYFWSMKISAGCTSVRFFRFLWFLAFFDTKHVEQLINAKKEQKDATTDKEKSWHILHHWYYFKTVAKVDTYFMDRPFESSITGR